MSVVVVGLEHQLAPLDILERVTVADADYPKVLAMLRDRVNLEESVLLSTCLRTEVYAVVDRFHEAVYEVQELLADRAGLAVADLEPYLSIRFDDDVPTHLFQVASGLKSAVLGESEVLGQVRRAWERAQAERVDGPVLAGLFRHAVETGKRVRTQTAIARGTTSFSHAAVELAEGRLGGTLGGQRVVVVGAGEMGAGLVQALGARPADRLPAEVVVVNRTTERAEELVATAPAGLAIRTVPLEGAGDALAQADLLLAAAEVAGPVVDVIGLAPTGSRTQRPLLVVDLGVPRNVDPKARGVRGITLLDMDDLRSLVAQAMEGRQGEAREAMAIVGEEVDRYRATSRARGAAPVVAALRAQMEAVRVAELERRRAEFKGISDTDWTQVDLVTRAVMAKLLHEPTVLLKEAAGTPRGERLLEALRILFDL